MTKKEFLEEVERHGFDCAMGLLSQNKPIVSKQELRELVKVKVLNEDDNAVVLFTTLIENPDAKYFLYEEKLLPDKPKPIRTADDIEDILFDLENNKDITFEDIQNYIEEHNLTIVDVFTTQAIYEYVDDNLNEICENTEIVNHIPYEFMVGDVYTEEDIIDYVKDNFDVDDLIETDIRWRC